MTLVFPASIPKCVLLQLPFALYPFLVHLKPHEGSKPLLNPFNVCEGALYPSVDRAAVVDLAAGFRHCHSNLQIITPKWISMIL